MNYLSICSGIEAASKAWEPLNWKPFAFSEIEPFPCAVLAHHWPDVPNLGDMTQFHNWSHLEDVDLLVGGTPCQAFSVAGLRKSLDDARGNLSLTYIQILDKIDNERAKHNRKPAICVWENVPGVLSTKDNAFGCFLAGLAGEDTPLEPPRGKWTNAGCVLGPKRAVAWRVLDAQYFGVAQRRRRVFVVASAGDDFDPAAILFELESVRRHSPPSREARQNTTADAGTGFTASSFGQYEPGVGTLRSAGGDIGGGSETLAVAARMVAFGEYACDETASTMKMRDYKDATDLVVTTPEAYRVTFCDANGTRADRPNGGCYITKADASGTLTSAKSEVLVVHGTQDPCVDEHVAYALGRNSGQENAICIADNIIGRQDHNGGNGKGFQSEIAYTLQTVGVPAVAFPIDTQNCTENHASGGKGFGGANDPSFTLTKGHSHAVAFAQNTRDELREMQVVGALAAQPGMKQTSYIRQQFAVRRLTPTECERLQGFPDGHTQVPTWNGWRNMSPDESPKSCIDQGLEIRQSKSGKWRVKDADGPRYEALGNSMAVPCMAWIGKRIHEHLNPPSLLSKLKQALLDNLNTRLK